MAGHNPSLVSNYTAGGTVRARRIVVFDTTDGVVVEAGSATASSIGVSTEVEALAGEPCDVIRFGAADVVFGGTVVRGALVTSDAQGRAVTASPAAGVNNRVIGIADVSAVVGDIGPILVSPGSIQG